MPNNLWLYKSADSKIIINVSSDPLDRFGQSKSHFGVVFQGQSNGDTKSPVTVQISWLQNHYHCIFWSTGQIWTIKGQIGVVFQGQASGEVKSAVQLYKWWMMRFWRTDGTQLFKSRELSPTMTSEWILQTIDFFLLDIIPVLKSIKEWRLETDF